MGKFLTLTTVTGIVLAGANLTISAIAQTQSDLFLAYPPPNHQTTASQIFLVGTAPADGEVLINGKLIERSPAGHFAPSFPLQIGDNQFVLRHKNQELQITVTRTSDAPKVPTDVAFAANSLTPASNITRLPGELICFGAIVSRGCCYSKFGQSNR